MSVESKEKIAELLKRKLDELKERDGDLSGKRPAGGRKSGYGPGAAGSGVDGKNPSRRPGAGDDARQARQVPQFGETFDPSQRLSGVAARSAVPFRTPEVEDPWAALDRWRTRYRGVDVHDILENTFGLPADGQSDDHFRDKPRGSTADHGNKEASVSQSGRRVNIRLATDGRPTGIVREIGRHGLIEVIRPAAAVVPRLSIEQARSRLLSSLWLLPGVRDRTADSLCCERAVTIEDLAGHPKHGRMAAKILRWIDKGDAARLMAHVAERGGAAHPLNLAAAAWYDPSEVLFLDIETAGLFGGSQIVVTGLAYAEPQAVAADRSGNSDVPDRQSLSGRPDQSCPCLCPDREERFGVDSDHESALVPGLPATVRLLVATTPDAEADLVAETARAIQDRPVLVSFNGRSFDLPYVCQRAAYYGSPVAADPVHFDLLGYSRRLWRGETTNCRLSTLAAEVLGMKRGEDVPGALVPWFYEMYLQDPAANAGLLAAIAIHNFYDMEQTVRLYAEHVRRFPELAGVSLESQAGSEDPAGLNESGLESADFSVVNVRKDVPNSSAIFPEPGGRPGDADFDVDTGVGPAIGSSQSRVGPAGCDIEPDTDNRGGTGARPRVRRRAEPA